MFVAIVTARLAGLGDDVRLALVLLGVEQLVGDSAAAVEQDREPLALLDAGGAHEDQDALGLCNALRSRRHDRVVLLRLGPVDEVRGSRPRAAVRRLVGIDQDVEVVDLQWNSAASVSGGSRHAGQLVVEAEEVLVS